VTSTPVCLVCGSADLATVASVEGMPALCNAFAATAEEAIAMPRGDIVLVSCNDCGMLHNARFDPALAPYDSAYENSLHFSPKFQEFAERLAHELAERHGRPGGVVIEIGSGGGDFLSMVAGQGFGRGIGIDPSLAESRTGRAGDASLELLAGTIEEAPDGVAADLIVCRHVLEHVPDPVGLLREARDRISHDDTRIYVEVPDAEYMVKAGAVWDLIYEHVGYFTDAALRTALSAAGWRGISTGTAFGGQYRWAEASVTGAPPEPAGDGADSLRADVEHFGIRYAATLGRWDRFLEGEAAAQRRVAAWGAGSKGVAFSNSVASPLAAIVDINPRKHGRYVPGTGDRVSAPSDIAGRVDTVLVMNPLYLREVEEAGVRAGVRATYLPVE